MRSSPEFLDGGGLGVGVSLEYGVVLLLERFLEGVDARFEAFVVLL